MEIMDDRFMNRRAIFVREKKYFYFHFHGLQTLVENESTDSGM